MYPLLCQLLFNGLMPLDDSNGSQSDSQSLSHDDDFVFFEIPVALSFLQLVYSS